MSLSLNNYSALNVKERTRITTELAIGSTAVTVENNQGIAATQYALLGRPGTEGSEIKVINGVTGALNVTISATTIAHKTYEELTILFGNKLRVYRAPNVDGKQPAEGAFVLLPSGTIDIDPEQLNTVFTDPEESSNYWYKFTYFNSTSGAETLLSQSLAARGGGVGQYCSLESIRDAAGFKNNRNLSDTLIEEKRQAAQDYINGRLSGKYVIPFAAPINAHISNLTRSLAAAYVREDQYGSSDATSKAIAGVKADIEDIRSGQVALLGVDGVTTETGDSDGFVGFPNGVDSNANGETDPFFTIASVKGYHSRTY